MKTLDQSEKNLLIKQAHSHLDIIEGEIKRIFDTIKAKRAKAKKAA